MAMREVEIPAAMLPGTKTMVGPDGAKAVVQAQLGLADMIILNVLSQADLMTTQEGCDLVLALHPKFAPLCGESGVGKKVLLTESQLEAVKARLPRVFPNGVPPEAQLAAAECFRAILCAKVINES